MKIDLKGLDYIGRMWLKYLKEEIAKDSKKSSFVPRDPEFVKSFGYKVEKGGIVTLYSTWPWLEIITNGTRGRYAMTWLTRQFGIEVVPLVQKDGSVHFRTAPLTVGDAWIHPKIAKHTFINRAYERAVQAHANKILDGSIEKLMEEKKRR